MNWLIVLLCFALCVSAAQGASYRFLYALGDDDDCECEIELQLERQCIIILPKKVSLKISSDIEEFRRPPPTMLSCELQYISDVQDGPNQSIIVNFNTDNLLPLRIQAADQAYLGDLIQLRQQVNEILIHINGEEREETNERSDRKERDKKEKKGDKKKDSKKDSKRDKKKDKKKDRKKESMSKPNKDQRGVQLERLTITPNPLPKALEERGIDSGTFKRMLSPRDRGNRGFATQHVNEASTSIFNNDSDSQIRTPKEIDDESSEE